MKKSKLVFLSALLVCAFALASCGTTGEKAKEEAKKECKHDHEKEHKCDSAKMDSCKQAKKDTTECEHKHAEN